MRAKVGPTDRAICGLSGGVDSSVAAILCHKALGDRLTCIFVDNGLLRQGEAEQVVATFRESFQLQPRRASTRASASSTALARRHRPGAEAKDHRPRLHRGLRGGGEEGRRTREYLVQGTLYPDVIESVSFKGPSAVIKSHHNVGGLPERMNLKLIEPLRELFKDEVRAAGEALGMPHDVLWRHPFPGPGLAVRCLGEVTERRLDVAPRGRRHRRSRRSARRASTTPSGRPSASSCPCAASASWATSGPTKRRARVRAVTSVDGMTADWAQAPVRRPRRASRTAIINEVRGINRVVLDISSKPPATIEWE